LLIRDGASSQILEAHTWNRILIVVEGTKLAIDTGYRIIFQGLRNVFIVFKSEVVVSLHKKGAQPLLYVNLDLVDGKSHVLYLHLVLRHVDVEGLKVLPDPPDLLLDVDLLMIELNVVVLPNIFHEGRNLLLKGVHVILQRVFLAQIIIPELVQGVIVDLKQVLDAILVMIKLLDHLLLLCDI